MTPEYIEQHQVIERYLAGRLSAAQTEEFEARLLWDTQVQEQFELTRRLREGVRALPETSVAAPIVTDDVKQPRRLALAASLLVAVGAGFLLSQLLMQPETGPVSSGSVYSLDQLRGETDLDSLPTVRPGNGDAWLTLLAYPVLDVGETFQPTLSRQAGDGWIDIWLGETVVNESRDGVAITVRGDLLRPGVYRLSFKTPHGLVASGPVYFRVP